MQTTTSIPKIRSITSPTTGKTYTYNWDKSTDPTDDDLDEIVKAHEPDTPVASAQPDKPALSGWQDLMAKSEAAGMMGPIRAASAVAKMAKGIYEAAPIGQLDKSIEFMNKPQQEQEDISNQADKDIKQQISDLPKHPYHLATAAANAFDPTGTVGSYMGLGESAYGHAKNQEWPELGVDVGMMALPLLHGTKAITEQPRPKQLYSETINAETPPISQPKQLTTVAGATPDVTIPPKVSAPRALLGPPREPITPISTQRFPVDPSGQAIDLQDPSTIDIFGKKDNVYPLPPKSFHDTVGDPSQANAIPPIDSLPKVDTSVVAGGVPETGLVAKARPTVVPLVEQPTVIGTPPVDMSSLERQPKFVGSGTTIPKPPNFLQRLLGSDDTGAIGPKGPIESVPNPETLTHPTAKSWAEQVTQRDKLNLPDSSYRDIMSTASKNNLKKGETWRSRAIDGIKYFESINKDKLPPVEPVRQGNVVPFKQTKLPAVEPIGGTTGRVAPFKPTSEEYQSIANKDNVIMGGVRPERGVPVVHDETLGGYQHHVRGNENWVTHPMLDKPAGPFKTPEEAFDWSLNHQETPEFQKYLDKGRELPPVEPIGPGIDRPQEMSAPKRPYKDLTPDVNKRYHVYDENDNLIDKTYDHDEAQRWADENDGYVKDTGEKDRPQEMKVREGGYSGTEDRPVGPVIVNPKTGRPNLAMGGADPQVLRQLGTSLYTKDRPSVLIQELMQNTVDEMKIAKVQKPVRVAFAEHTKNPVTQKNSRSITFQDFGRGMNESQLYNEFSDVGKSGKRDVEGAAGGFGFAKAAPFLGGDHMRTESVTIENGQKVKYTFGGKPEEFLNQEVGVPLEREVVPNNTPTGMRIEVFFPENKSFYNAKDLLKTITENSPDVKDVEAFSKRVEPDTLDPTSATDKFTKEGDSGLSPYDKRQVEKYQGKPLPSFKDTISTPENDANVYYDLDKKERSQTQLVFLNNGVFYYSETQHAGLHNIPYIPERVVIDVKSKVKEGHDKYPFPANRQGLNDEVKNEYRQWVSDKIIDPARNAQENEIKNLYDSTKPKPGNNHVILDSGERYTPEELKRVENSPALKNVASVMGDLLHDLEANFDEDERVATTDKFGYRIGELGSGGMNISDPATSQPDLKTLVTINPFDAMYTGMTKRSTWTYTPRELLPAEAARRFVHLIKHEYAHNLARNEGAGFTWAFSQLDTRFGDTPHYEAQILKALTDRSGNYAPEIPQLLQDYLESRRRPESKEDILARQAASIKDETGREPEGIPGSNKPDGEGITPPIEPIESGPREPIKNWGGTPETVTFGKGGKLRPNRGSLDYPSEADLPISPSAPPKGKLAERFGLKPEGGGPRPPIEPPVNPEVSGLPEDEPPNKNKYSGKVYQGGIDPNKLDVTYPKSEFIKGKENVEKIQQERAASETVDDIIKKKVANNPILKTPTFKGAIKALPDRFRNSALYTAIYEPVGVSQLTKLERMGPGGKNLAKLLTDERTEGNRYGGEHALTTREAIRGLSKDEQLQVTKVLDGQLSVNDVPQKIADAYTELRSSLDKLGKEAIKARMRMRTSKGQSIPFQMHAGEYWPHMYDEALFKDPKSLREKLLAAGNSPFAVNAMIDSVIKTGERFSPAQHARDFNLPGYRMDMGALEKYQYQMAKAITRAKRFGPLNVSDPKSPISQYIKGAENPTKAAEIVNKYLGRVEEGPNSTNENYLYSKIVEAEVASKLSQFGITNMSDLANITTQLGYKNTLKSIYNIIRDPHGATDISTGMGSQAILRKELLHDVGQGNLLGRAYGTMTSEKLNRTIGSLAGRVNVQQLFEQAKTNPKYAGQLAKFVDGDVKDVLKQDQLTQKQIDFGGARGVEISSGYPDRLTLPDVAYPKNSIFRLPFLFKRFGFVNMKNIADAVRSQPTTAAKFAKAAAILATYQVAGETVGDIKSVIRGLINGKLGQTLAGRGDYIDSKSMPVIGNLVGGKVLDRLIANSLQSALFGIVGDVAESTVQRKVGKASGIIGGPVVSDIDEALSDVASAIPSATSPANFKPAIKSVLRRVPYIGSGLEDRLTQKDTKMLGGGAGVGLKGLPKSSLGGGS